MSKAMQWSEVGFDLLSLYHTPYYIMGFYKDPTPNIHKVPLLLKGATLNVGDAVACIYSPKSSAGFEILYPAEPLRFVYQGIYRTLGGEQYVLWLTECDGEVKALPPYEKYVALYYAHAMIENDGSLLFTLPSGAGRVIESDEVYFTHNEVPEYVKQIV